MESLTVPTQMVATADRFDLGGMITTTGDRPAVLATIGTRPDGGRYLRASLWDGTDWQNGTIDPGVAGAVQDVALAGNSSVTGLAGWTWESGASRPFLLTSADRRSWTRIPLPDSLAGFRIVDLDVDGGRAVGLAQDARGTAAVISLDQGGTPTVGPLPEIPSGQDRDLTAIAASGATVVATGGQGPDRTGGPKAFRSTDGGLTWSEPTAISSQPEATVNGITRVPSGFVATGAEPASGKGQAGEAELLL
jgi:hypothetical protein